VEGLRISNDPEGTVEKGERQGGLTPRCQLTKWIPTGGKKLGGRPRLRGGLEGGGSACLPRRIREERASNSLLLNWG